MLSGKTLIIFVDTSRNDPRMELCESQFCIKYMSVITILSLILFSMAILDGTSRSLPRKSVVWLTDRPDMTLNVYRGRKTTVQQQQQQQERLVASVN